MVDEKNDHALQFAWALVETGEPTGRYEKRIIGMHDHWLSEEAEEQIIFYQGIHNEQDYQHYLEQEANLVALYLAVHCCAPLLVYDEAEEQFQALHDVSALIQQVTLGAREKEHYLFYSPAFDSIWTSAHDVAVVLYLLDPEGKPAVEGAIAQLVKAHNLYMLH
ncbi:hypothetical protein [Hymenobacter metallicola]|uniref:Uncharacterized protein n=1 Tax=Hymenobacter metallicola TaxID=2563114 RepID=A0A4Z0PUI8_9BACT|nr:hypothetical protein [Hymenobacter metallicola]TGE20914.1 hypothetical protein E5K02_25270 [Hymenobacter metallicola]